MTDDERYNFDRQVDCDAAIIVIERPFVAQHNPQPAFKGYSTMYVGAINGQRTDGAI